MRVRRYTVLDVFTDTPLAGNPLAVVHDADDVDDATMLRLARETRLSETTFVQSATAPGADYRNRIWTVHGELPFAGHPSLGTAVAVARERGEALARYVQQTGAGCQPLEVRIDGDGAHASMLQEPAAFGPELDPGPVLAAAGLVAADAHPGLPPQVVSTGAPQVLVPLGSAGALARVRPDWPAVDALLRPHAAVVLYLAWADPQRGEARARALFPHGARGGEEDPATGSAAGPLCAYLAARAGCPAVTIHQGAEMGRPSVLEAALAGVRVRVGGSVIALVDGTIRL